MPDTPRMSAARALELNGKLVEAWFVRARILSGEVPDLSRVSLAECQAASAIVAAMNPQQNEDGTKTFAVQVDPEQIPDLYAWASATSALDRICRERSQG